MSGTFSDSWHEVSHLKVGLLPSVRVHKQLYRGREWYVLQELGSEKYYRVTPIGYKFVASLSPRQTVGETWDTFVKDHSDVAPGQEDVIQLLSQLHHSNLLFFRSKANNEAIFERYQKQKIREHMGKLMAFLYVRLPMWDPNRFLNNYRNILSAFFSPLAFFIWLVVIVMAGKAVIEQWDQLWQQTQGIIALGNLPLLYLSVFVLKIFHEMAHAAVSKKYGATVHTMGIMFIVFTPLPYIDASSSWSMRNRWHRVFVGSAGMYVEMFLAATAALVWVSTGSGLLNSLAFNLMVAGSVSSLLFNGNPLLRFDAYYMLADAMDIPNLYQKANQQLLYYLDRFLLGTPDLEKPADSPVESFWVSLYGVLSVVYRLMIMVFITSMVANIWIGLGVLMVIMMAFVWVIMPLQKLLKHLFTSPKLMKNRPRAFLVSGLITGLLAVILLILPMPYSLSARGVVEAAGASSVYTESGGLLMDVLVRPGDLVQSGDTLFRYENSDMRQEFTLNEHQITETHWQYQRALETGYTSVAPFLEQLAALQERKTVLQRRLDELTIKSPVSGVWSAETLISRLDSSFARGTFLGRVVPQSDYRFVAAVSQAQSDALFTDSLAAAEVRIRGQAGQVVRASGVSLIPFQQFELPSAALGIQGGGEYLSETREDGRVFSEEPFFELVADLPARSAAVYYDGAVGLMRVALAPKSLGWQLRRYLLQLLQRRYQI